MLHSPIRLPCPVGWILLVLALAVAPGWAAAQSSASDAAAAFGSLSPEQQQAVLEQLGSQGGTGGARGQ